MIGILCYFHRDNLEFYTVNGGGDDTPVVVVLLQGYMSKRQPAAVISKDLIIITETMIIRRHRTESKQFIFIQSSRVDALTVDKQKQRHNNNNNKLSRGLPCTAFNLCLHFSLRLFFLFHFPADTKLPHNVQRYVLQSKQMDGGCNDVDAWPRTRTSRYWCGIYFITKDLI